MTKQQIIDAMALGLGCIPDPLYGDMETVKRLQKELVEATELIAHIGYTSVETGTVIQKATEWMASHHNL